MSRIWVRFGDPVACVGVGQGLPAHRYGFELFRLGLAVKGMLTRQVSLTKRRNGFCESHVSYDINAHLVVYNEIRLAEYKQADGDGQ